MSSAEEATALSNTPAAEANAEARARDPDPGEQIATILVEGGVLTEQRLRHARRVREKLVSEKTLLQVLEELGFVTKDDLQKALRESSRPVRVGALLVELGNLRPSELEAALGIQRERGDGRKLGEILIDEHFVEDTRLAEVLSFQLGHRHIEASVEELDRSLVSEASVNFYRKHHFVPISRENDKVVVAFADPLEASDRAAARSLFGDDLVPAVTTKSSLLEALSLIEGGALRGERAGVDDDTAVGVVHAIIGSALDDGVSDIHIEPMKDRLRVRFCVDGVLMVYKDFSSSLAPYVAARIKILSGADIAEKRRHQDGRILYENVGTGPPVDLRVSIYATVFGEKIVIRVLNKRAALVDLGNLGMAPKMLERFRDDALDIPSGVLIVTGPTGSGKTTTLYSAVNHLNEIDISIITAEDPVEYVVEGISQCSINPKINLTFEETLRHIVRQDPDIIVLGEIRDRFSADTAIQAALTGHKVLTTFHTEDSIGGLLRLLNMNIEAFLISSTVVCVVAQRLLRKVCEHCAEPYQVTPRDLHRIGWNVDQGKGAEFRRGRGCKACRFTGYRGRAGVFELLVLEEPVKEAILERKTSHEIRRISMETSGLVTLLEDGALKAAKGVTSIQEVLHRLPRIQKARPLHEIRRLLGD